MIIKINFLPKEKKKPFLVLDWGKIYIFSLVVVLLSIVFSFLWLHRQVQNLEARQIRLQQEKKKYALIIAKINELKKKESELSQIITTVLKLNKKRGENLKVFDEVMLSLPQEKMYLTKFSLKDRKVFLQGFSLDYDSVARFLTNLKRRKIFSQVNLNYAKKKKVQDYELVEFSINLGY
ncbi:PilN domain-containing protein [Thermosulfurimonas marina]|uniref:PilN domain-containing protein n=1 Tax=Thermosulfurimonas marina TaxID=2047767 RepID=A0A6H1WQY6_9BACT|nr:PilN domain-containing protein [Thermosulfurimonas marina]QJA05570.1 PilN domain-containing protein [Thermosulfurimonas marina]